MRRIGLIGNTMHKVAETIEAAVAIPLLHIGDTSAEAVLRTPVRRVGLLGTGFTMEQPFYADRLRRHGLDVLVPEPEDRALVHRVIYEELCVGVVRGESREAYREVMGRLVARGAEGVLLGCTEIELLVSQEDCPVRVFPTTRLHAEAAVNRAFADPPSPIHPRG